MRQFFRARTRRGAACCLALLMLATLSATDVAAAAKQETRATKPAPIDINEAGEEALIAIPGIGEATAERIVSWREEHGPFRRVEDLMKVRGIGEKSFQKIRPYVKVGRSKSK